MQTLIFSLLIGFVCGVIGSVYRFVLSYEGILNWWFKFGDRYEQKWFYKPVWGCAKCFSGQLAGWTWVIVRIIPAILRHCSQNKRLHLFSMDCVTGAWILLIGFISAISAAVALALIISPILENRNKQ